MGSRRKLAAIREECQWRGTMEFLLQPMREYVHPCLSSDLVSILCPLDLVIDRIWFRPESDPLSLEEVAESLVPPPLPAAATGGDMVAEQERAVYSAEAQILAARVAAATDRRDSSPPTSKLSTGKMNPRAPEWNKRLVVDLLLQSLI